METEKRKKYLTQYDQRAPIISEPVQREICKRIARGETIKEICKDEALPTKDELYDLIWRDPEFERMYKTARLARSEVWVDEMHLKAQEAARLDEIPDKKAMAHVQAIRLQIDTDKWLVGKHLPAYYGDQPYQPGTKAVEGVLEIIKMVAGLAREPVKGDIIDIEPTQDDKLLT